MSWLGAYNVPVIILSATLPTATRVDLIKAYMSGTELDWEQEVIKPEGWESNETYPLITYNDGKELFQNRDFNPMEEKQIQVNKIKEDDLLDLVQKVIDNNSVIGIVVNTVRRAQKLAVLCVQKFGAEKVQLLHSNFIATERIQKEKYLLDTIGKKSSRPNGQIVIGTQVIEQSLDIDFDTLVSDLAPMDLLLQRVGRLHRHTEVFRHEAFQSPILHVMGTDEALDFESGSSHIYGDYLLTRSQYFLPEIITLPTDISTLVQKVYGQDDLNLPSDQRLRYSAAKKKHENYIKRKTSKARNYQISKPNFKSNSSLIGWLKYDAKVNSEEAGSAQVRDIEPSIEVIALKQNDSGYTFLGREDYDANPLNDTSVCKEIAKQTLRLPRALTLPRVIDHL